MQVLKRLGHSSNFETIFRFFFCLKNALQLKIIGEIWPVAGPSKKKVSSKKTGVATIFFCIAYKKTMFADSHVYN